MNALSPSIETPPDPIDGALCDAVMVALHGEQGVTPDIVAIASDIRAELRRMDIELILVVRVAASRRTDTVTLATYTQVLAQRNAALKELALYRMPPADGDPAGYAERQIAAARRLALSMQDDVNAARAQLAERDAEIARLKREIDTLKPTEDR